MSVSINRRLLFWLLFCFTVVIAFLIIKIHQTLPNDRISASAYEVIVNNAKSLYRQRLAQKIDFSSGPCLTNDLMPGWVVDIVHNPRQAIDDLPHNQCPAYVEGRANHFVELDTNGNLVRVK